MPIETTDLTNFFDPPPSPHISSSNAPMILNFDHVLSNPNLHHHVQHHRHQTTLLVPPTAQGHTNESIRITTDWPQPATHGRSLIARVLRPLLGSDTMPFPNGSRDMVPWSQLEHDLFVMGMIKYGKGKWSEIAKNFVCNKTPQQVQSYGNSFFRYLPGTYLHGLRKRKRNNTNNMIVNNDPAKKTLNLFPDVPRYYGGEASSSKNTNNYEASTSMTLPVVSVGNGEVDVELRLGLN